MFILYSSKFYRNLTANEQKHSTEKPNRKCFVQGWLFDSCSDGKLNGRIPLLLNPQWFYISIKHSHSQEVQNGMVFERQNQNDISIDDWRLKTRKEKTKWEEIKAWEI